MFIEKGNWTTFAHLWHLINYLISDDWMFLLENTVALQNIIIHKLFQIFRASVAPEHQKYENIFATIIVVRLLVYVLSKEPCFFEVLDINYA